MVYHGGLLDNYSHTVPTPGAVRRPMAQHVPPSRKRYEAKNPTVSVRVSAAIKARMEALRATTGKSMAAILLESLGVQEATAHEAYQRGFKAASDRFRVVFPCVGCRKGIVVDDADRKALAVKAMTAARIGHKECV